LGYRGAAGCAAARLADQQRAPAYGGSMDNASNRWTRAEKVMGLLTALATLIVAVLGVFSIQAKEAKDAAQSESSNLTRDLADLHKQAAADKRTIDSLEAATREQAALIEEQAARIRELEGQSTPEVAGAPDKEAPAVYHQGTVTLRAGGDTIYFNAPPGDETWSEGDTTDRLSIYGSGGLSVANIDILPVQGEPATYATCSSSTAYIPYWDFDGDSMDVGEVVCARGSEGRYGTIKIGAVNGGTVTLEITTWETS
jgi:hypothetical protein